MGLASLLEKTRWRFFEVPTYTDGPDGREETHTQTLLTAATHEVDDAVNDIEAASNLLQELTRYEPALDWDKVEKETQGWPGVLETLRDIITAAVIVILGRDNEIAAEERRRQEQE